MFKLAPHSGFRRLRTCHFCLCSEWQHGPFYLWWPFRVPSSFSHSLFFCLDAWIRRLQVAVDGHSILCWWLWNLFICVVSFTSFSPRILHPLFTSLNTFPYGLSWLLCLGLGLLFFFFVFLTLTIWSLTRMAHYMSPLRDTSLHLTVVYHSIFWYN